MSRKKRVEKKRRRGNNTSCFSRKIMSGTPFRTTACGIYVYKHGKINKGTNIIMQKHCRQRIAAASCVSIRSGLYAFVARCKREDALSESDNFRVSTASSSSSSSDLWPILPPHQTYTSFLSLHPAYESLVSLFARLTPGGSDKEGLSPAWDTSCRQMGP